MREQVEVLEDHADLAAHPAQMALVGERQLAVLLHVRQRLAVDLDDAAVDPLERHQHAQDRGLARTGRADDRDLLVGGDLEIELIEHHEVAIALGHLLEADHGRFCGRLHAQPLRVFSQASSWRTPAAETRLMIRKKTPTIVIGSR